jgi:acetyltransferase-like isoleucine patch superfamily enzyme
MRSILFNILNTAAKKIRGKSYQLDESIPLCALIRIMLNRLFMLLRAISFGYLPLSRIFISRGVRLINRSHITIGRGTSLGEFSIINGLSKNGINLGSNVSIGDYSRLEASGTITDIGLGIKIGDNTGVGAFCFIGGAGGVSIGSDVIMGQWVSFHPENHNIEDLDIPIRLQGVNRQGITVEDDCWIGAKATFLDGAHVGRGCVIAAGAVVRGVIPPYSIAGGVPAKVIRSRVNPSAHDPKHPVPPSIG